MRLPLILLPADWPLDEKAFKDERNYWPIRVLEQIGQLPHDLATWLGTGHSIPNGDPAKPYDECPERFAALSRTPRVLR